MTIKCNVEGCATTMALKYNDCRRRAVIHIAVVQKANRIRTDAVARRRPLNLYHSSLTTLWGDGEDGVMLRSRGVRRRPDNFERKGKKERADEEKHEEGEHDVEKERGELENLVVCSGGILFGGVRRRPDTFERKG